MNFEKIKKWLTFKRVTKTYLWYVVIRWVLRWVLTFAFFWWVWYMAPLDYKNSWRQKMHFKMHPPDIEWVERPQHMTINGTNRSIIVGLQEDGKLIWKEDIQTSYIR